MADFNSSKVDGDSVDANEWNQLASIDNFIATSGQPPSTSNLNQMGIGAARYSSGGQFFTDSGTANAYVLTSISPFKSPVSSGAGEGYFIGMEIKFRAGNPNTGASTVNLNSAGVKNLKKEDGTTDLDVGDISTTQDSVFRYNGTAFCLANGSASTTAKGIIEIATDMEVTTGTDSLRAIVPSAFAASKFNSINLISTAIAASSSSIDFTGLNSNYSKYIIEIQDLIPATNGAVVIGRVSIDNGATYITGSSYISSCVSHNPAASWVSHNGATSGAGITSSAGGAGSYGLSNVSSKGLSGVIIIHNPSNTATHKKIEANGCYDNAAGDFTQFLSASAYEGTTNAVTAFRILLDTGNIASGSFKLFGIR
jgi:hypothetical protein